jgi:signal transduction histidine kinase
MTSLSIYQNAQSLPVQPSQTVDGIRVPSANALEAMNEELAAVLGSVCHSLRSPLWAIEGFGQALADEEPQKLTAEGANYVQRILRAQKRMVEMLNGLSRLAEVARRPLDCQPVDLSAMVNAIANELLSGAEFRGITFVVAPSLHITADPHLLRLAVRELLHNACKFTRGRPSPCVEFNTLPRPTADTDTATFFVRDNGVGYDESLAQRLFSPFHRLHPADQFPGLGAGLTLVRRVIHRHGGYTWAHGTAGQGATFLFSLPSRAPCTAGNPSPTGPNDLSTRLPAASPAPTDSAGNLREERP